MHDMMIQQNESRKLSRTESQLESRKEQNDWQCKTRADQD